MTTTKVGLEVDITLILYQTTVTERSLAQSHVARKWQSHNVILSPRCNEHTCRHPTDSQVHPDVSPLEPSY